MEISDRRLDTFDNRSKNACREANLLFLRRATYRLWEDSRRKKLRCDWCELMGKTGHLTRELLLRESLIVPSQFVGIDINDELVNHHSAAGVSVLRGDLFSLVARPELSRVGILNLDGYYAVNSPKLHADLCLIRLLAMSSIKLYGEFCIFLNADLDAAVRQRNRASAAMREHANLVADTFVDCGRCQIQSDLLLPPECVESIDGGQIGTFGMFEIYRGRKAGHRMANLRLVLG
jgi:hypothetical protein